MNLSAYHPFRSAKAKEEYLAFYDRRAKQWPVASESRMVETSFGQTFVRISGAVEAQPLVLLPGLYANSLMWVPNIEALSACCRTYAVDHIYDVGRSVYTRHLKTSGDYVRWLDELFTGLALGDQICLMGISFGGWQACQYALRFPNRLAKMVLLAPVGTVLPLPLEYWFRTLLAVLHPRFFRSFGYWIFDDFARKDETTPKLLDEAIEGIRIALRCFKPKPGILPTVFADKELKGLQVPTLYIVGEHEKIYSAQKAVQRLNRVAPHIKTEMIPQAGHDLTVVQTEMVNGRVLEFLNQPSKIERFWQNYLSTLSEENRKNAPTYIVDQFADTPEAATKVGGLVRAGVKTTTSSLLWGLEHIGEPIPKVGNIELIVDGNGDPLCIIELTEVEIKPFNTVDAQFAFEYGEGDRTLALWLRDNWDFHSRWCIEIGREPSKTMPIIFQRFRLVCP
jgi:uncharacterized protein YhfF/pimeloyl-ACP methyl ester carboxylesterase